MCFEVRFAEDLDDPVFAATLRTELGHTIVVARSDQHGRADRRLQGRRNASTARFELPNWLTPSRYTLTPSVAREGTGDERARAGRGHGLDRDPRRRRAAASSSCRSTSGSSAHEHQPGASACPMPGARRAQPPRARPVGARRRLPPLLVAHVHARAHRIQAALLRLGARLPVDADAAAAAVRRAVGLLHQGRPRQRRQAARRSSTTAPSCSARSCCSPSSPKRPRAPCAASSTARTWCARSTSRGW